VQKYRIMIVVAVFSVDLFVQKENIRLFKNVFKTYDIDIWYRSRR